MSNGIGAFHPDWVSAPGETIADILSERNLSLAEFAHAIEQTPEQAIELLDGRASISIALARRLERSLGAAPPSPGWWWQRPPDDLTGEMARDLFSP